MNQIQSSKSWGGPSGFCFPAEWFWRKTNTKPTHSRFPDEIYGAFEIHPEQLGCVLFLGKPSWGWLKGSQEEDYHHGTRAQFEKLTSSKHDLTGATFSQHLDRVTAM